MYQQQWNGLPIVIFGTTATSFEVQSLINDINSRRYIPVFNFLGFVAESEAEMADDSHVVTCDAAFPAFAAKFPVLGAAMGVGDPHLKKKIYDKILSKIDNLVFPNLVSPFSALGRNGSIKMGVGNIIYAGTSYAGSGRGHGMRLGNFVTILLNSVLGHEMIINDFSSVNSVVALAGNVQIGTGSLIGAGAAIRENIKIGNNATVGMGAVVVKDVPDGVTVAGSPARFLREKPKSF